MTSEQTEPRGDELPELPVDEMIAAAAEESAAATEKTAAPADRPHGRFERVGKKPVKRPTPPPEPAPEEDEEDEVEPPRKRHPAVRALVCIVLVLALLGSLVLLAADQWLQYHRGRGKAQLRSDYDNAQIEIPQNDNRVIAYDDGKTVHYNGKTYRLNENITTVLFMGVDRKNMDENELYGTSGQADGILLIALDIETGDTEIININRDTYAEMTMYSAGGVELDMEKRQICLAYAYGDGREKSCENMVSAVSKLLYGMPIANYLAVDMEGVLVANETVGGVTVQSLNDIQMPDGTYVKTGDEITLHGKNCERYIRTRTDDIDANLGRMARQKQYVQAFAATLVRQAKSDFGTISRLYDAIAPYMVSTLDLSDTVYLAQTYLDHGLAIDFLSIDGTYDWLERADGKRNAVYYPDETSLFETVLEVYYRPVDE